MYDLIDKFIDESFHTFILCKMYDFDMPFFKLCMLQIA